MSLCLFSVSSVYGGENVASRETGICSSRSCYASFAPYGTTVLPTCSALQLGFNRGSPCLDQRGAPHGMGMMHQAVAPSGIRIPPAGWTDVPPTSFVKGCHGWGQDPPRCHSVLYGRTTAFQVTGRHSPYGLRDKQRGNC